MNLDLDWIDERLGEERKKLDPDTITWADDADPEAYDNAKAFLTLHNASPDVIKDIVSQWHTSDAQEYRATDILRATGYPSVSAKEDVQVKRTTKKMKKGEPVEPPLLVVRDPGHQPLLADGYHRLCAVYEAFAEAPVPLRVATWLTEDSA